MRKLTIGLLAGAALAVAGAPAASASNAPLHVNFVKHLVDPQTFTFAGSVNGDVDGNLVSRLVSLSGAGPNGTDGPIYKITFDWIVSAGGKSFTARTSGMWNTGTGQVVMNGSVVSGYLDGAQVHEEGRLVDPSTLTFAGFLRLMPATAG